MNKNNSINSDRNMENLLYGIPKEDKNPSEEIMGMYEDSEDFREDIDCCSQFRRFSRYYKRR